MCCSLQVALFCCRCRPLVPCRRLLQPTAVVSVLTLLLLSLLLLLLLTPVASKHDC
jgi:hypothetical protein